MEREQALKADFSATYVIQVIKKFHLPEFQFCVELNMFALIGANKDAYHVRT
jgi:hypothetical protein